MGRVKEGTEQGMMTKEEALYILKEKYRMEYHSMSIKERQAICFAIDVIDSTCKPENEPTEEPKTDKGMFIPESPNDAETDDFVGRSLTGMAVKINQLEKELEQVLSELKYRVDNGEKRMWYIENKIQEVDRRVWK